MNDIYLFQLMADFFLYRPTIVKSITLFIISLTGTWHI